MSSTSNSNYLRITIDYSRDALLSDFGLATLKDRYLLPHETSPQEAFARAAVSHCGGDLVFAQRIYDYASKLWFMFSTPILSNSGSAKGLPISCFLNYVGDSRQGLNDHWSENTWLASSGGGIGGYWGNIRSDGIATSGGSKSTGSIPFMHVVDSQMLAVSQGTTRRGAYAAYSDISHPEIEEFIIMRKPTGGDPNRKNLNLHHGINITDNFMEAVEKGLKWDLVDPHSLKVTKTVEARALWETILETRVETGEPYIHFIDTTNAAVPDWHKHQGLLISQSNLCSEIVLPTSKERTAVCCLSSVNLEKYEEWHETSMIFDLIRFLDNVLSNFIKQASEMPGLSKAVFSASQERSLGLGAMGFHSFLQSKGIPFEGAMAVSWNRKMFKCIREEAELATDYLGELKGDAPDFAEYCGHTIVRRRNCYLMAIAPNASSSILGNTSPSIEPVVANIFTHKTHSGSFLVKNKYLDKLLSHKVTPETLIDIWKSILENGGSVQHLDILSTEEKEIFKTAKELDQRWLIEHASHRQEFIDQAQSVNLFFHPGVSKAELHKIHMLAWKKKLKTLYYLRSEGEYRPESLTTKVERTKIDTNECLACEG